MNGEAKTFVDTNVLLYAYDSEAGTKREEARAALTELWARRRGALSVQVLQEFYVNVTRKIASPLPKKTARRMVDQYAAWCGETTVEDLAAAFRIEDEGQLSFWDALIIASAAKSGATRILSEDFSDGQRIAGVLIENPFAARG